MKCKIVSIFFLALGVFIFAGRVIAQEKTVSHLDYEKNLILDSDLDGLTDKGEKEIFKTDLSNPDSDGDGFLDGAEVLSGNDPLDSTSPVATRTIIQNSFPAEKDVAWSWYVTRATGLTSFILLYVVMFLGLSIRTPILNRLVSPLNALNVHTWLSVQALILVFVHGGALLFDKFLKFNLADVTIPFVSQVYTNQIAVGILATYLLIILLGTSYAKNILHYRLWRAIHFLNVAFYIMAVYHSLSLGTDLARGSFRVVFIWANVFLALLIVVNIVIGIFRFIRSKHRIT